MEQPIPKAKLEMHPALSERKAWRANKTWKHMTALKDIFKDRDTASLGLTKNEVIALYQRISLQDVISMRDSSKKSIWEEINSARKVLRKEGIMAIVSIIATRGFVLKDDNFGKRTCADTTPIYHKCVDMGTALIVKARMGKIAEGIENVSDEVMEITENEQSEEKKVVRDLNGKSQVSEEISLQAKAQARRMAQEIQERNITITPEHRLPKAQPFSGKRASYGAIANMTAEQKKAYNREYMRKYMAKRKAQGKA